jgi:hypothetical protein
MTVAPARTASGAKRFDVPPPAENSAMSTPAKLDSVSSRTGSASPRNGNVLPAERAEANSRSCARGKRRSSRQRISSTPTAPVARTIATTGRKDGERAGMRVISGQQNEKAPSIAAGPWERKRYRMRGRL